MNLFQKLFSRKPTVDLKLIIDEGTFLVDVRTAGEFAEGHVKGSVNIPLHTVSTQLSKFENKKNIIVFCRSGARSRQAKSILAKNRIINVINGGTWHKVNEFLN